MTYIPGVDMNRICDGQTLGALWSFYTINVKYLGTLTHEDFCKEFPNAAREIERACRIMDKMNALVEAQGEIA